MAKILKKALSRKQIFTFVRFFVPSFLIFLIAFAIPLQSVIAASGVPTILSYQGRLTNSSGDLVGGSGTTYYFKFSIWDNPTVGSGSRQWPGANPSLFASTVRQGVFNVNIGDTANGYPDPLTYNFNANKDVYLQVEVSSDGSSFETLSPRQRISATAFSRLSESVSGTSQSSFGTTTPVSNAVVTIEATTSSMIPAFIRAAASQIADLFRVENSSGSHLFSIGATGGIFGSSTLQVSGNSTLYGGLSVLGSGTSTFANGLQTSSLNVTGSATSTISNGLIVNGGGIRIAGLNCTSFANGGKLRTDASGNIVCDDDASGGSGSQSPWTSNINGAGFSLNNGGQFTFTNFIATSTSLLSSIAGNFQVSGLTSLGSATTTSLAITGVTSSLLKTNSSGSVVPATPGTDYLTSALTSIGPTGQTSSGPAITLATSTAGTDFTITGSGSTMTFNLPSASASNRGLLSSTDFTTFNNKLSSAITALGPTGQTQTGATQTLASSTSSFNGLTVGLTIVGSGNTQTFTPTLSGTLTVLGGGTGISTPSAAGVLLGNYAGTGYQQIATSSLGLLTTNVAEGSNLYYLDTRVQSFVNGSTTIPKTYTSNTFSGLQTFNGGLTLSTLNGPLQANNGVLSATTSVGLLYGGTGATTASGARTNLGAAASGANSDITSLAGLTTALSVPQGGTGWGTIQANTLLLGNGSSQLSTTSAGTNGQVLALVSGVPTWTATTTAGTGLSYGSGSFSVNTSQNIATLSNLTSNGFIKTSGGNGTLSVDTSTYLTSALTSIGPTGQTSSGPAITLATSTAGTDFTITGSGSTMTFNLPSASASNRGLLSSTDFTTFNNKLSSAITALGPTGQTQTGATQTLASSTSSFNGLTVGLTIVGSGNTQTFTPTLSGTLTVLGGGTGISTPSAAGVLLGNYAGTGYQQIATSSLGLLTTNVAEGSNLYYLDTRVQSFVNGSTTIPKTYTSNTFSGLQTFNGGLTLSTLNGPLQANNGVLSATTSVGLLYGGTGATTASGARTNLGAAASGANSDITSLAGLTTALSVPQGGTGWGTIQANTLLLGNGSSQLSTTSAGTNGQVLALVSGVPTWTATTTAGTGLSYGSGSFSVNTSQNIATLSNLTSNGFIKTSGGNGTLSVDTSTYLTSALTSIGPTGQTSSGPAITLATSTAGTDFTITGSGSTMTFNLPSASASNRGLLSSTDFTTFNNKLSSAITALGPTGQTQTGATQTLASSTSSFNGLTVGLTIVGSGNTQTFTPTLSGTLTVLGGGTGISTPSAAGVLLGNYAGTGYQQIATSSLGLLTTNVAEGSNLYYLDTRVQSFVNGSTTIPKTYTSNTFSGLQTFNGGLTLSTLNGPLQANNGVLSATTSVGLLYGGTGATTASGARTNLGAAASGANSDITSLAGLTTALSVPQGGTGWGTIQANTLLLGNGSSQLSTTSAGTNGQVLALVSGVPTWTATTTAGTGLSYGSGSFSVNTSQNIATLSNLTSNGFIKTSGGNGTLSVDTSTYLTSALTSIGPTGQTSSGPAITLATSTAGTDFTITGSGSTMTFNLPSASASNRGLLSSTDFTTFNNKLSSAITALGPTGQTQTGATQTLASSTSSFNGLTVGLTIVGSGNTQTFTPTLSGTLTVLGGGTGISTPSAAGVLLGNYAGTGYQQIATSSLGLLTTNVAEGSNLYYLDTRVQSFVNGSTTIPKTYTSNTFSGLQTFNGGLTLSTLNGPLQANNGVLSATTSVGLLYGGTGATTASGARTNLGAAASGANSDITSLAGLTTALSVPQGGTGWGTIQANTLLLGNGSSQLSTTSAGTNGQVLALVSGVPTWTATTTAGTGLSYGSGSFSLNLTNPNTWTGQQTFNTSAPIFGTMTSGSLLFAGTSGLLSQNNANLFWDNTNTKLGVGTTTPWAELSVNSTAGQPAFTVGSSTGTSFVVDKLGNIGIGTSSPTTKLTIGGSNPTITITDTTNGVNTILKSGTTFGVVGTNNAFPMLFIAGGSTVMTALATNGNIGIGTTSPYQKLSVAGNVVADSFIATTTATSTLVGGLSTNLLNVTSSTATSSFANGIDLTSGCFSINSTCVGGGSGSPGGLTTQVQFNSGGSFGGSSNFIWDDTNAKLGLGGTTSPFAQLSVNSVAGQTAFVIGSSTATTFLVDSSGKVGVGVPSIGVNSSRFVVRGTSAASSGSAFNVQDSVGSALLFVRNDGNVGLGTTSPYQRLSVAGNVVADSFIATSTATSTLVGGLSTNLLNVTSTIASSTFNNGINLTSGCFSINNTCVGGGSGSPGGLTTQVQFNSGGSFGGSSNFIWDNTNSELGLGGTTSPYAQLSVNSVAGQTGFIVGSSTGTSFVVDSLGNVGIGTTSTNSAALFIDRPSGFSGNFLNFYNESAFVGSVFRVDYNGNVNAATLQSTGGINSYSGNSTFAGNVGIGSTSPFAQLSVIGGLNETDPSFILATTTTWGDGQRPLIYAFATTTGKLDYARVAIGTTSPWGNAGIRDQLTVDGRLYTTWRYMSCDVAGSPLTANLTTTDTANVCGQFVYDSDTDSRADIASGYPPYMQLRAGGNTNPTAGDGASLRSGSLITSATTSPIMEAWIMLGTPSGATTTPLYLVGLYGSAYAADTATLPVNGIYFAATSTPNWKAITRKNNVETMTDTGIATSTTVWQKMRIEADDLQVKFIIDGKVVAVNTTNIPSAYLSPTVLVSVFTAALAGQPNLDPRIKLSLIRFWMDDPPGGMPTPSGQMMSDVKSNTSANISQLYGSDETLTPGDVVSLATDSSTGSVKKATYDQIEHTLGIVTSESGVMLGTSNGASANNQYNVAIVGQASIKVSDENGPISVGDYLTLSPTMSGVATKATKSGFVIGQATDAYTGSGVGTTTISIHPTYYYGRNFKDVSVGLVNSASDATNELASIIFATGRDMVKFVAEQVVAKVAIIENLFTKNITVLKGGRVTLPAGQDQTTGSAKISSGASEVFVSNNQISSASKIFITPTSLTRQPLIVTQKTDGQGFKVEVADPASVDITFDWLVVDTYGDNNSVSSSQTSQNASTSTTTPSVDTTTPVITIQGNNPAQVVVGTSYTDLGASVTDTDAQGNVNNNLGLHFNVDGSDVQEITIDTGTTTTHTIVYSAVDAAGNWGYATRTVEVVAQ